jgi:hypothetical protein
LFFYCLVGTSRLYRVVDICHSTTNQSSFLNTNTLTLKRYLSNISSNNKDKNDLGINTNLYKPSTNAKETHVSDKLKGGQPTETIDTAPKSTPTLTGSGNVWSVQNPGSVHIASSRRVAETFVPPSTVDESKINETTVHSITHGHVNIADPFTTHTLQSEATPARLAEAAAASAFETFAPDTPLTTPTITDTVFSPKISSTDTYSEASSPTGQYEHSSASPTHDTTIYETTSQSKVFGGQDTSASSKKHPNENAFETEKNDKTRQEIIL